MRYPVLVYIPQNHVLAGSDVINSRGRVATVLILSRCEAIGGKEKAYRSR